jgi:hypothetical protein
MIEAEKKGYMPVEFKKKIVNYPKSLPGSEKQRKKFNRMTFFRLTVFIHLLAIL